MGALFDLASLNFSNTDLQAALGYNSLLGSNSNYGSGLSSLFGSNPGNALQKPQWSFVRSRFQRLLSNIEPTSLQFEDVETKAAGVLSCLNREYWPGGVVQGDTVHLLAGSWRKKTRSRCSSDIDIIYFLPWEMYRRYEARLGNKQSAILQEIKNVLMLSYPGTDIRCDGPTIIMSFWSYKVEIVPAFRASNTPRDINDPGFQALLCDTNNGGRYKPIAPTADCQKLLLHDQAANGDLCALIRMAKIWKYYCSVPIKSFYMEQLGIEFLAQWSSKGKGVGWYDWMLRDFFAYMLTRQNGHGFLPVTNEVFFYGNGWASRAETAFKAASRACSHEQLDHNGLAGEEWQKIFGTYIPKEVG